MESAVKMLEKYVSMPSGSYDKEDSTALGSVIAADLESLGFEVTLKPGKRFGPVILGEWGKGTHRLMLMGHYDTVFPHDHRVPFSLEGDIARGSGVMDMKGGLVVMLQALSQVLGKLNPETDGLSVVINADEEIGSDESHDFILGTAKRCFAALSFEPCGLKSYFTCERKGVTAFRLDCTGIRGHAGAMYKQCASAVQELCARITQIYTLRDDANDISINFAPISGGTAENVVADEASARGEYRYYDQRYMGIIHDKLEELIAQPGVPGTSTKLTFLASHPACKQTPESLALYEMAREIAAGQGRETELVSTGGAGDISIASLAGIPVLDGLGLEGDRMHSLEEYAVLTHLPQQIELAGEMIVRLSGK